MTDNHHSPSSVAAAAALSRIDYAVADEASLMAPDPSHDPATGLYSYALDGALGGGPARTLRAAAASVSAAYAAAGALGARGNAHIVQATALDPVLRLSYLGACADSGVAPSFPFSHRAPLPLQEGESCLVASQFFSVMCDRPPEHKRDAAVLYPQLATAFGLDAAAKAFAAERLPAANRESFVVKFQALVERQLMSGAPLSEIRVLSSGQPRASGASRDDAR